MAQSAKPHAWIMLIGLILVLLGIYGVTRTAINLTFLKKYPATSVYSLNFMGMGVYGPREEDCKNISLYTYPPTDSTGPSVADKKQMEQSCLDGIKESRNQAKVNDISTSVLFLFLGCGVFLSKKLFLVS